ncbi:hypothetical protein I316_04083 [Kwoniella heveanensis BCC8398]|uniref:Uncharacterized protein n=1 Tax=Kwoniella heveanensis BCC8398 TaxID=1296120 RepID=A0A1B9GST7_9TREE|nr:hypothetical protein I316_04083 [Kwoniella heveanensis BCC8398]
MEIAVDGAGDGGDDGDEGKGELDSSNLLRACEAEVDGGGEVDLLLRLGAADVVAVVYDVVDDCDWVGVGKDFDREGELEDAVVVICMLLDGPKNVGLECAGVESSSPLFVAVPRDGKVSGEECDSKPESSSINREEGIDSSSGINGSNVTVSVDPAVTFVDVGQVEALG